MQRRPRTTPLFRGVFVFLNMLLLGGCATTHTVKIASVVRPAVPSATLYRIEYPKTKPEWKALHDKTNKILQRALAMKGFREAQVGQEPELLILCAYGIGPSFNPKVITVQTRPRGARDTPREKEIQIGIGDDGKPIKMQIPVYDDSDPIIVDVYESSQKTHFKQLHLRAYILDPGEASSSPAEAWAIDAFCESVERDISTALPRLIAASLNYIGRNSSGTVSLRLRDDDEVVSLIRKDN